MSELQSVVVAALRPPILDGKAQLFTYVKFLGQYDQYVNQGGMVAFSACLPEGLRQEARFLYEESITGTNEESDEEEEEAVEEAAATVQSAAPPTWDQLAAAEQKKWIHRCFRPASAHVTDKRLRKITMANTSTFSKSAVREHLSFFARVLEVCAGVLPDAKEIASIMIASLRPQGFADMVKSAGGKRKRLAALPAFILTLAGEYEGVAEEAAALGLTSVTKSSDHEQKSTKYFNKSTSKPSPVAPVAPSPSVVAPIANKHPSSTSKASKETHNTNRWPSNMCLGCGYVFDPPHRRDTCPFKAMPGWCREGVPKSPMVLRPNQVSSIFATESSVSMVDGRVIAGVHGYREVRVGLDTMCCMSLVHPRIVKSLENIVELRRVDLPEPKEVATAGTSKSSTITQSVELTLAMGDTDDSPTLVMRFGIMAIPADILIGWSDICRYDLMHMLHDLANVHSPALAVAPEETLELEANRVVPSGSSNLVVAIAASDTPTYPTRVCSNFNDDGNNVDVLNDPDDVAISREETFVSKLPQCMVTLLRSDLAKEVMAEELPAEGSAIPPMVVELKEAGVLPPTAHPSHQAPTIRQFTNESVESLVNMGFVTRSTSPCAARVVIVKRSEDRSLRMCHDYRGVNECTKSLNYPLPNLKGIIDRLKGHSSYATLDLRKGYYQVLLDPASRYLTAFVTEDGQFEYTRVPFGLKNAPAYFQNALTNIVLAGLVGIICEVYIDDIVVFADSDEQLAERVKLIMERLQEYRLRLNAAKCVFGCQEIEYLGYHVSAHGVRLSDEKKQGLLSLSSPSSVAELRSFLGLANYFRDFIPYYSTRAAYLYRLASPKSKFVWDASAEEAFHDLKTAVASSPMLHHIDYSLPLVLRTDASQFGVGAVLVNISSDGRELPICFISQKFSGPATRWSTIDQEAYAIFFAVKKLSHYLRGQWFVIQTDHNNLRYIQSATEGKVGRWRLLLQEYDYIVQHIPGKANVVADCLSRCCGNSDPPVVVAVVAEDQDSGNPFDDPEVMDGSDESASLDADISVERKRMIESVHNAIVGHHGIGATIRLLLDSNHRWPHMRTDVVNFIHQCAVCQKSRVTHHDSSPIARHVIEAYEPFEEFSLDSIVGLPTDEDGHSCILVAICSTTRFVECFAAPDVSAKTASKAILALHGRYGAIGRFRSDRGGQFVANINDELRSLTNTDQLLTIGYRPQANGIVERENGEIIRHLSAIVNDARIRDRWSLALPIVQRIVNARKHSSTGCSAIQLLYGGMVTPNRGVLGNYQAPKLIAVSDYIKQLYEYQLNALRASQLHLAKIMDRRATFDDSTAKCFQQGDYVLVSEGAGECRDKLAFSWRGPLLVVEGRGNMYTCLNLCTLEHEMHDISVLKLFELAQDADPLLIAAMDDSSDPVERILEFHIGTPGRKKSYDFLVQFRSGTQRWLPYMEVRKLQALDSFLQDNPDACRALKLQPASKKKE